ncbi:MAG: S-adenosylmethionine--tRNA-ribosyltransferase-isomerase [Verrucomicrobia bacterium]|nr:S-adenosylmethionine--tRNA-ribosyltransferase-isomerase [Verrucomicrobiota bacterium]
MAPLATDLFDYDLPAHLIAQAPAARRDESRLLVVDRAKHTISHRTFRELGNFLRAGDTLFRNNAAVLPARLHAQRPTGGQVECFLLRPTDDPLTWRCLVKPGKKLPVGAIFAHSSGLFRGEIVAKESDGSAQVRFTTRDSVPITAIANQLGAVPLPPYIARPDDSHRVEDLERYQTVYANRARQVAVAAPTAGLHFTPELLAQLSAQGIKPAEVTLHVGLGTFKPILTDTIEAHEIHRELYELPAATRKALAQPTGRRVAIGTTTVRTIEDYLGKQAEPSAPSDPNADIFDEAGLFIYPPYNFRGIDALVTNFHQPRSTLLCLLAAFLAPGSTDGIAWWREIYAEAIAREYRFFSYGDAMLIL